MNVIMTGGGKLVELQGTAEHDTFDRAQLDAMVDLAAAGIKQLVEAQRQAIARRTRMKRFVFASGNRHKVAEIGAMLQPLGWQVDPLTLTVEEDAPTFAGNAEKKARAALAQTGLPSLADDSGLEVDALGGAPGVLSARWAGGDTATTRPTTPSCSSRCAACPTSGARRAFAARSCFVDSDGTRIVREGTCEGAIAHAQRGAGGFGYDPLFLVGIRGGPWRS